MQITHIKHIKSIIHLAVQHMNVVEVHIHFIYIHCIAIRNCAYYNKHIVHMNLNVYNLYFMF